MKKQKIKKMLLGEVGAGIVLIIIQFIIGFNLTGSLSYMLGSNIAFAAGVISIIDGCRKLNKDEK